jgi:hypothetical protein
MLIKWAIFCTNIKYNINIDICFWSPTTSLKIKTAAPMSGGFLGWDGGTIPRAQGKIVIENCRKKLFRGALCQKATRKIPGPKYWKSTTGCSETHFTHQLTLLITIFAVVVNWVSKSSK